MCCLVVMLLLFGSSAPAQLSRLNDSWRWVRFGTESGLPSAVIHAIYESGDHVAWVHTGRGLAWYDGHAWREAHIEGLPEVSAGLIRISPDTAGLLVAFHGTVYSVRYDGVRKIPIKRSGEDLGVAGCWRDRDGSIILLGSSALYRLRDGEVQEIDDPQLPAIIKRRNESSISLYPTHGGLWLRSGGSLSRYDSAGWKQVFRSSEGYLRVHQIVEAKQGNAVAVLEPESGSIRIMEHVPGGTLSELEGESGDLIESMSVSASGTVLLLYSSGELRQKEGKTWTWLPPFPSPVRDARVVEFMSNGDLWVGGNDGLYLCRLNLLRWEVWDEPGPSLSNWVNEILRGRDGTIWIGTRDGLQRRSPDGTITWIRSIDGMPLGRVTAVGEDLHGAIWIGSGADFDGAFRYDGKTWKHIGEADGLRAPRVHRITRDRHGRLWFLCINKSGVLQNDFSDEPGAFMLGANGFEHWGMERGLLDGRVYSFVEDSRGGYWFGTYTGLSRYRDGQWTYWSAHTRGLHSERVFTLAIDSSDIVHFAHQFADLGYIDSRDSVHYVTRDAGLIGMEVWEVRFDSRGWLWAATKSGLACWNGSDWYHFGTYSGLRNDRLWPVLPLDTTVLVGTEGRGVAVLHLNGLNRFAPRVVIDEPLVENYDVTLTWKVLAAWGDTPSDQIETRYRLSGGTWSSWSIDHGIIFRDLRPGDYRLDIEAKSSPAVATAPYTPVWFDVPPPLYLRPVFFVPATVTAIVLISLSVLMWIRNRTYNRITRENEARFRAQYKGNPVPTFTFRRSEGGYRLTDYNDAALTMTLGHAAKWVGLLYEEILPHAPEGRVLMDQCYRSRSTIRTEYRYEYQSVARVADLMVSFAFVPPDLVLVHTEDVTERQRSERQLRESGEQLRALAVRLQSVREEERTRLSREIHDELGQIMTGLKMDLAWIRRRVLDLGHGLPEAVAQRMMQMNALLEDAIHTVRKIAGQLRPAILDDLGIVPAMEWQARDFSERTGIPCSLDLGTEDLPLAREAATELFRIYQEMLTNVARHAQATQVEVRLRQANGSLELVVCDNGRGISVSDAERRTSLGILGMEERAKRIGGTLSIGPGTAGGTVAGVVVPVS